MGRKGTFLSGEDVQLYNFNYKSSKLVGGNVWDSQVPEYRIENLDMLQPLWGNKAEEVFHLAFCEMAKAAAPLLVHMAFAQDAVVRDDADALLTSIEKLTHSIELILQAFMKIIPDDMATLGVDPLVWAKTVAPVGVSFNKGMPSPSGLGTPFFHMLDVFLGRGKYSSILGRDSVHARDFFPPSWMKLLRAVNDVNVYVYVVSSDDTRLHAAWSHCLQTYASWNGMLGKHLQKTYGFLELAFKTGREKTLGGFGGGFRDRMWDKIMDMLDAAREERLRAQNSIARLPLGEPIRAEGKGTMITVEYKLPHESFSWKPGDTVGISPTNSKKNVDLLLNAIKATGDEVIALPITAWRIHMKSRIDLGAFTGKEGGKIKLRQLLEQSRITTVPKETAQFLAKFFPAFQMLREVIIDGREMALAELLGLLATSFDIGGGCFGLGEDGNMKEMRVMTPIELFETLDKSESLAGPLMEEIIEAVELMCGTNESIPILRGQRANFDEFESSVYPTLTAGVPDHGFGNIFSMLVPIKPRQYSIANLRHKENNTMVLMVSRLGYVRRREGVDIRDKPEAERLQRISTRVVRKWRTFVAKKKSIREAKEMREAHPMKAFLSDCFPGMIKLPDYFGVAFIRSNIQCGVPILDTNVGICALLQQ
mmetsp:Transcript_36871/g.89559  ORF Transcript_36871/g.89559 Transcript_36871/m.89559 type:complete len:651 (-) Transcript_36871:26-1978(-)